MRSDLEQIEGKGALWMTLASCLLAVLFATPAMSEGVAPVSMNPAAESAAAASTAREELLASGIVDVTTLVVTQAGMAETAAAA